jgi:hypothetical protein
MTRHEWEELGVDQEEHYLVAAILIHWLKRAIEVDGGVPGGGTEFIAVENALQDSIGNEKPLRKIQDIDEKYHQRFQALEARVEKLENTPITINIDDSQ